MNELGSFLKELRGKKSLRDVQKSTGISHTYLSTLEKGIDPRTNKPREPSVSTLKTLAKYYNVPYIELMKKAGYIKEEHAISEITDLAGNPIPDGLRLFVHEFLGHFQQSFKGSPLKKVYLFIKISKGEEFYYFCIRSYVVLGNINIVENTAMVTIISESCDKSEFFNSVNHTNITINKNSEKVPFIHADNYFHNIALGNKERGNAFLKDVKEKILNILKNDKKLPLNNMYIKGNFHYMRLGTTRNVSFEINTSTKERDD